MKFTKIIPLMIVAGMFVGCGKKGPESVAEAFFNAIAKGNTSDAVKLATEDSKVAVNLTALFPAFKQKASSIKIEGCTETGDAAVCKTKSPDKEGEIALKKVNGEWKVNFAAK